MPSDAPAMTGDEHDGQLTQDRDGDRTNHSSGTPKKSLDTRLNIVEKNLSIALRGTGLEGKKPTASRQTRWFLVPKFSEMGTHLTAEPIAHHGRPDLAGHGEGNARRVVNRLGRRGQHGHRHGVPSDPATVPPQFLERTAITNPPDQADRRRRPLSRRERRTLRPARVAMRERKPCFFARRRLLGWNVRFTRGLRDLMEPAGALRSSLLGHRLWWGNGPGLTHAQEARHLFGRQR